VCAGSPAPAASFTSLQNLLHSDVACCTRMRDACCRVLLCTWGVFRQVVILNRLLSMVNGRQAQKLQQRGHYMHACAHPQAALAPGWSLLCCFLVICGGLLVPRPCCDPLGADQVQLVSPKRCDRLLQLGLACGQGRHGFYCEHCILCCVCMASVAANAWRLWQQMHALVRRIWVVVVFVCCRSLHDVLACNVRLLARRS
jgi:hypothetical protein